MLENINTGEIDFSCYVMRMTNSNEKDDSGNALIDVYIHQELEDGVYLGSLCEECDGVPKAGQKIWISKEIAHHHDWPHGDLSYCSQHLAEMIVNDFWVNGVKVDHYNVPSVLVPLVYRPK